MKGHVYKPGCKCPKEQRCRCNAKWGFMVDVGTNPATGKRKQKFKGGFGTKKEAEAFLSEFLVGLKGSSFQDPSKMLFKDLSDEWIECFAKKTFSKNGKPGTVKLRKEQAERLVEHLGFAQIRKIDRLKYQEALENLKNDRKQKKGPSETLSDNTMIGFHSTGKMIFDYAVEKQYLQQNPATGAGPVRRKKSVTDIEGLVELPKYLEKEQLKLFLETAQKHGLEGDAEAFYTIAYSGLRAGEYCALDYGSLDFKENTLSVTKTLYNPTGAGEAYEIVAPKTVRSIRTIKMDPGVMKVLRAKQIRQMEYKLRYPNYFDGQFVSAIGPDRMFAGRPENIMTLRARMKRILRLAGLSQNLSTHSLRHTHVSLLAEAGVPLEVIMDRLGHGDDKTTRLIYMHVTKHLKEEAAQKFTLLMGDLG